MIIPDVNLLFCAYNTDVSFHKAAKVWWEDLLNGNTPIGLPWHVSYGYLRIMTSGRILENPISPQKALEDIAAWVGRQNVEIIIPGPRHMQILSKLLENIGIAGNLTSDAVLAALCIEYQAELHSNDADFSRFPGLKWVNPLKEK